MVFYQLKTGVQDSVARANNIILTYDSRHSVFKISPKQSVLKDLRRHGVRMLTLGQYLQPSAAHVSVKRYLTPAEFAEYQTVAEGLGFSQVASAPLVRSSYHADLQAGARS